MDLTVSVDNSILNVRVAVVIRTAKGFVLEKSKGGYLFLVGGRIKIGETSEQAAVREIMEELGIAVQNLKLKALLENFYRNDNPNSSKANTNIHEICFVYSGSIAAPITSSDTIGEFSPAELQQMNVKPEIMKKVLESKGDDVLHLVCS